MNLTESKKVIAILLSTYPNYNVADEQLAADTWFRALEDIPYKYVSIALSNYIQTNTSGFAPIPSQIRHIAYELSQPQELSEMQAWSLVMKAVRNSSYHAEQEYNNLPELVRQAIGTPSQLRSMALDEDFNEGVAMSNFQRTYREIVSSKSKYSKSSNEYQTIYDKTQDGSPRRQLEDYARGASVMQIESKGGQIDYPDISKQIEVMIKNLVASVDREA